METINLKHIWEVMNELSFREGKIADELDKYIQLLGHSSNYSSMSFEGFLNYYSFRIDGDNIVVFNTDSVAWENFNKDDISSFPSILLSFSDEKLSSWIDTEIELQLAKQERDKIAEKEDLKRQIEQLNKQYESL